MRSQFGSALALFAFLAAGSSPQAAALQTSPTLASQQVGGFFERPVQVGAPERDPRLFVAEQYTGLIKILEDGIELPAPFLDLGSLLDPQATQQQGFLGFAFHPRYADNGYLFVHYTDLAGDNVIARYQVSASDPNVIDVSTAVSVLTISQPLVDHNGGRIAFGPDGLLYIGIGDGGGVNDPLCAAQDETTLLGKVLRIDVDAIDATGSYGIPPSNPLVGVPGAAEEIWQLGFRQPWRFGFDRSTGDLYIGEVGEEDFEEVNFAPMATGGINYGWQVLEHTLCTAVDTLSFCNPALPGCDDPLYTGAIAAYPHDFDVWGCAIIGGTVYRGEAIPDLQGTYFFADFCTTRVWSFEFDGTTASPITERTAELVTAPNILTFASIDEDGFGELYLTSQAGFVLKIVDPNGAAPTPPLVSKWDRISLTDGGAHELFLDAGESLAGQAYFVLGSRTGTSPGTPVDGFVLPLNFDAYTTNSALNAGLSPWVGTVGLLDGQGRAEARIEVPPGASTPALIGLVLNHAYVTLDVASAAPAVSSVSNAATLELLP